MGKGASILKASIITANSLFTSPPFFNCTGMRLIFSIKGRVHHFRCEKNRIQVEMHKENEEPEYLGIITVETIKRLINIGQHILSLCNIKASTVNEDNLCCICLERNIDILLTCGHGYCEQDIIDWEHRDRNCPMCRRTLVENQMYTSLEHFSDDKEIQSSIDELLKLIRY